MLEILGFLLGLGLLYILFYFAVIIGCIALVVKFVKWILK